MKLCFWGKEPQPFLHQSAKLEEEAPPPSVKGTGLILSLLTVLFLGWTAFSEVEEIVLATGEVVPIGFPQTIQHYDGGIVAQIFAQEGSTVKEGDVLLRIDGTGTQEELNKARVLLQANERRVETAQELFDIQKKMKASGAASDARFIEAKQALGDATSVFEAQKQVVAQLEARAERLQIKASVTGTVKGLHINTVGAVIKPGEPLMDIVPSDRPLVVEARISPQDIGQVNKGQPVRMKISAFDYSRYGMLDGNLDLITATTFYDVQGKSYYRARIKLDRPYLEKGGKIVHILPGMTAQVGIITGKKTIFSYLFKPIQRALENSLSER